MVCALKQSPVSESAKTVSVPLLGGFALEVVEEVQPSEDMLELPGMEDELRRPMMLLVRSKKQGAE